MCLIAWGWRCHPQIAFALWANRDERADRPTQPLHWWNDPRIAAGQDLQAGGAWLGINTEGRLAALTNYREFPLAPPTGSSRGELVVKALAGRGTVDAAAQAAMSSASQYAGFNLLLGNDLHRSSGTLHLVSNRPEPHRIRVALGVGGLSNGPFLTPWPKVNALKARLAAALSHLPTDADVGEAGTLKSFAQTAWRALEDRSIAPDTALPETGLPRDRERLLSPAFIRMTGYGTRSMTVLVIGTDGRFWINERTCSDWTDRSLAGSFD